MPIDIPLTAGFTTVIDDEDSDLTKYQWRAAIHEFSGVRKAYAVRSIQSGGKTSLEFLHRVVVARMIGRPLIDGECVDHVDRDPVNNRRFNLRLATHAENMRNRTRQSNNRSGYKGVYLRPDTGRWYAGIRVNGKKIHLGVFDDPRIAHEAYCAAAKKHFGAFANSGDESKSL